MSESRELLIDVVRRGLTELAEPVELASGDRSRYFVDCKRALARGSDLALAGQALVELAGELGITYDAVGGLTMGADAPAHAMAAAADVEWFSVRKVAKDRGTRRRVEGADLGPGRRVLLLDEMVTRGGSILDALAAIRDTGATVAGALTIVDRGADGAEKFAAEGIPYAALFTWADLGIPAIGTE